jgi:hypothetical protein
MKKILTKAYEVKLALEYHMLETNPKYEVHMEEVSMMIVFGHAYIQKNPLDLRVNVNVDCDAELAELFELIKHFKPMTKTEKAFKMFTKEIINTNYDV